MNGINLDFSRAQIFVVVLLIVGAPLAVIGAEQAGLDIPGTSFSITNPESCGLSASQVQILSNSEELNREAWRVEMGTNCGDSILTGGAEVDQSDLEGTNSEGKTVEAETGFEFAFENFDPYRKFNIETRNGQPVPVNDLGGEGARGVDHTSFECSKNELASNTCGQPEQDKCDNWQQNNGVDDIFSPLNVDVVEHTGFGTNNVLHCFTPTKQEAFISPFATGEELGFTAEAVLEADGTTKRKTITGGSGTTSVTLGSGDRQANVQWTGNRLGEIAGANLDTNSFAALCGNGCSNPDDPSADGWKVIPTGSSTYYSRYLDYRNNFESKVEGKLADGFSANGAAADLNTRLGNLKLQSSATDQVEQDIGEFSVGSVTVQDGGLVIRPENVREAIKPIFTIDVVADWIGFKELVADPDIREGQLSDITITAQQSTSVQVPIQNRGSAAGDVEVVVSCQSPVSGGSTRVNVPAGEERSASVTLQTSASDTVTSKCVVTAQDRDAFNIQDRASFNVNVQTSCQDADGDGVCREFDQCPDVGPSGSAASVPLSGMAQDGCAVEEYICDNGVDEDGNGLVDNNDPACEGDPPKPPQDSDNDGVPDDRDQCPNTPESVPHEQVDANGCEINTPPETEDEFVNGCTDGEDNDGDGLIDDADPDCQDRPGGAPWPLIIGAGTLVALLAIFRKQVVEFAQSLTQGGVGGR